MDRQRAPQNEDLTLAQTISVVLVPMSADTSFRLTQLSDGIGLDGMMDSCREYPSSNRVTTHQYVVPASMYWILIIVYAIANRTIIAPSGDRLIIYTMLLVA